MKLALVLSLLIPVGALRLAPACRSRVAAPRMTDVPASENVAVVLLAGGSGSRMKADRPKQFLELRGKPVLEHLSLIHI